MDQIIAKKFRWLRDEWEHKEQRRKQKRAVKSPHSVALNITSSPVLQYSLIISKHPFICQQPCIKKRSSYVCLVIYIAGVYACVDAGMAKMKKQTQNMDLCFCEIHRWLEINPQAALKRQNPLFPSLVHICAKYFQRNHTHHKHIELNNRNIH